MNIELLVTIALLLVSTVSLLVSLPVSIFALIYSRKSIEHSQQTAIKDSTDIIFKEWWSDELDELREYFFREFIPKHRAKLIGRSMKEIEQIVPEDKGRARNLCYFFDRVGWLGAAGLIEIDYVLGPMLHAMHRTWWVMEPLIEKARELRPNKNLDPVFQFGFEWLFKHSKEPGKHQADLLGRRFRQPAILNSTQIDTLRAKIDADEADFTRKLNVILNEQQNL